MNKQQKSNLAKTAIKLLGERKIKFDMSWWSKDSDDDDVTPAQVHECGTTCCFAGYGPVALNNGHCYGNSWDSYIHGSFGVQSRFDDPTGTDIINFLFSSSWPDDKAAAASRALYVLENGAAPKEWGYNNDSYRIYSAKTLKKKLQAFIYKRESRTAEGKAQDYYGGW